MLALITLLWWFMGPPSLRAATYYIDASLGSDANPGTQTNPWQTLAHPNDSGSIQPGDTILFKRGEVWRQPLRPPIGGTQESQRIFYGAYGTGDAPTIIDGKYFPPDSSWQGPDANGEYYLVIGNTTEFPFAQTNAVRGQNTGINTYKGMVWGTLGALAEDSWDYSANGTDVLVWYKPLTGHLPTEYVWEFATYSSGYNSPVYINNTDFITIDSLRLINSQDHSYQIGVVTIKDSDYVQIRNCEIYAGGEMGIALFNSNHGQIDSNLIRGNRNAGIWTEAPVSQYLISNNTIRDNSWGTTAKDVGYDRGGIILNSGTSHLTITGNTIGNNGSTAPTRLNSEILLDGTDHVTIAKNYLYKAWRKAIGMSATGPNTHHLIYSNIIHNWNLMGDVYPWHTAIVIEGIGDLDNGYHQILNNTIYSDMDTALYGINLKSGSANHIKNTTVANNLIYFQDNTSPDSRGIRLGLNYLAGTSVNHNLVWGMTNLYELAGTSYTTLNAWQTATGYGQNDLSVMPLFSQPLLPYTQALDFQPTAASPVVDAGASLGLSTDFAGNPIPQGLAPDLGAFEYTPPPTGTPAPGPTATPGPGPTATPAPAFITDPLLLPVAGSQTPTLIIFTAGLLLSQLGLLLLSRYRQTKQ